MTSLESKGPFLGIRHLQTLLLFLNILVVYVSRVNIGVAIVAMTNAATTNPDFPEYDWTEQEKSYIISSFYWGYVITQFPGGYFSRRFGTKITMFTSTFGSAIFSLLTPVSIPWGGWQVFCALRALQGLFQGVMFPAIHAHLAKWSPLTERNRLGALANSGIECGTVLAMAISGIIAEGPMGWPGISYISGGMCLVWCLLWFIFAANNPPASRFISEAEKEYIESSLQRREGFHEIRIPVPWAAIWTSVPFIALLIVRCAEGFSFSILQAQIPSYLNGVLNMEIKSNALYSALPFLVMWAMTYVYLIIADILIGRKIISLTATRKSINTVSMWLPAAGLIGIGFLDETQMELAITLMALTVGINAGSIIGSSLNTLDLSPNHAGILMGIVNCIANFFPLITPLIVGVLVTDVHNRSQWQLVFGIGAIVFFLGNLVYLIWGISETQRWDAADYMQLKDAEKLNPPIQPVLTVKDLPAITEDDDDEEEEEENDKTEQKPEKAIEHKNTSEQPVTEVEEQTESTLPNEKVITKTATDSEVSKPNADDSGDLLCDSKTNVDDSPSLPSDSK